MDSFLKRETQVTNCEGMLAFVGRYLRAWTAVDALVVSRCQFCSSAVLLPCLSSSRQPLDI